MGIIRKPIMQGEIEVARVSLAQPMGQADTICERIRLVYCLAQRLSVECINLTVYARRMDAALQKFHQGDYEI